MRKRQSRIQVTFICDFSLRKVALVIYSSSPVDEYPRSLLNLCEFAYSLLASGSMWCRELRLLPCIYCASCVMLARVVLTGYIMKLLVHKCPNKRIE